MSDEMQDRDFETLFEDDGMRVWLRDDEVEQLLDEFQGTRRRIAGLLSARCGLRREEIVDVDDRDVVPVATPPTTPRRSSES